MRRSKHVRRQTWSVGLENLRRSKHVRLQSWSALPKEIWDKIYKQLPMSDRIRFASICKDFLSIAAASPPPPPPPPVPESWLLFHRTREFLSLSVGRVYKFNNIIPPEHIILGASNGWVLTHQYSNCNSLLTLVNPISNAKIILPPIQPEFRHIKKVFVATFGDSVLPAGVFIYTESNFCIARSGDIVAWKMYDLDLEEGFDHLDIVLFHDGKLYTLMVQESEIFVFAVRLNEQLQLPPTPAICYVGQESSQDTVTETRLSEEVVDQARLVESRSGDLLLVKRFKQRERTSGFQVFKLVLVEENNYLRLVKLETLGDQALFWDRCGCISLPAVNNYPLYEENHIYFTNTLYEVGVYSLKDERVKRYHSSPPKLFRKESTWFIPMTN